MEAQSATSNSPSAASPRSAERESQTASRKDRAETGPADGFLFLSEDDLIRSVLDLTRELEKLGVIEIVPQPNGGDFYRILTAKKGRFGAKKSPMGELARRVGAIFRRRANSLWAKDEIEAFRAIDSLISPSLNDIADLELVEQYYHTEAGKPNSYCRTTLLTFLRHYPGEVDRARRWKETSRRRHCY